MVWVSAQVNEINKYRIFVSCVGRGRGRDRRSRGRFTGRGLSQMKRGTVEFQLWGIVQKPARTSHHFPSLFFSGEEDDNSRQSNQRVPRREAYLIDRSQFPPVKSIFAFHTL